MARTQKQKTLSARLLLPISFLLLIHLFFPHHHHYNSFHCENENNVQVCAVEITDALLRVSAEPDSQCPAESFHMHTDVPNFLLPFLLPFVLAALILALWCHGWKRYLFKPYISHYHAPWGSMSKALRAPPVSIAF